MTYGDLPVMSSVDPSRERVYAGAGARGEVFGLVIRRVMSLRNLFDS